MYMCVCIQSAEAKYVYVYICVSIQGAEAKYVYVYICVCIQGAEAKYYDQVAVMIDCINHFIIRFGWAASFPVGC